MLSIKRVSNVVDPFVATLMIVVVIASLLPCRGNWAVAADTLANIEIGRAHV